MGEFPPTYWHRWIDGLQVKKIGRERIRFECGGRTFGVEECFAAQARRLLSLLAHIKQFIGHLREFDDFQIGKVCFECFTTYIGQPRN